MPFVEDLILQCFVLQKGYTTNWSFEESDLVRESLNKFLKIKLL